MSRDRVADGRNWYAYCDNNPLNYVDPTGLETQKGWDTAGEAATAAAQEWTEKDNVNEHAGEVYQDPDTGKYYYTHQYYPLGDAQLKAGAKNVYPNGGSSYVVPGRDVPKRCRIVGSWHTHPTTEGRHDAAAGINQSGTKDGDGPSPGDEAAMRKRAKQGQAMHYIALGTGDVVEYMVTRDGRIIPKVVGRKWKDK